MTKISALSIRLRTHELLLHAVSVALMGVVAGHAYAQSAFVQSPYPESSRPSIMEKARAAEKKVQLIMPTDGQAALDVLPGGDNVSVQIPVAADSKSIYCATLLDRKNGERTVNVISATPKAGSNGAQVTELTLGVPDPGFGPRKKMELVIVAFHVGADGKPQWDAPKMSAVQPVRVSNRLFSTLVAVAAVVIAYLIAVLALGRIGQGHAWSPVYLTSGPFDKASLSQFQIFGFTLLVFGLLVYILFRIGILPNISSDILLLLGISAAGTAGSKVAGVAMKRFSFENWAWLRNNGWLKVYEAAVDGKKADTKRARWGDLLKTDGSFDIYSFQLATFSVLVGYSLLTSDPKALATFSVPANLLALLGLSNVVYIGGKAVAPNSVGELDKKLTALRLLETDWISAVAKDVVGLAGQSAKQQKAIELARDKATAYIAAAREAARMLKSIYSAPEDTKFSEPITEDEIMPEFP